MPQLDDSDPPSYKKYVEINVTLDMLSTADLIQELVNRNSLIVVTARRRVPRIVYSKDDFYPALQALISCDLAKSLTAGKLVGESVTQYKDDLEFSATIVVLTTIEEERPV